MLSYNEVLDFCNVSLLMDSFDDFVKKICHNNNGVCRGPSCDRPPPPLGPPLGHVES